jgi:hypothetical protein
MGITAIASADRYSNSNASCIRWRASWGADVQAPIRTSWPRYTTPVSRSTVICVSLLPSSFNTASVSCPSKGGARR